MHILILTVGTQGDVQPYVALGMGLKAAGYDVTVATSTRFAGLITEHGLSHKPLNADFLQLLDTPEGKAALAGGNPLTLMNKVMPLLRQLLDEGWTAAQGADAIIYHPRRSVAVISRKSSASPAFLRTRFRSSRRPAHSLARCFSRVAISAHHSTV